MRAKVAGCNSAFASCFEKSAARLKGRRRSSQTSAQNVPTISAALNHMGTVFGQCAAI